MLDLQTARVVDLYVDDTGKVWVNVDGKCVVRIGHAHVVNTDDPYRGRDSFELPRPRPTLLRI